MRKKLPDFILTSEFTAIADMDFVILSFWIAKIYFVNWPSVSLFCLILGLQLTAQ